MKFRNDSVSIDPGNPFANDTLERKPIVLFLEGVITKAEGPLVLALDSPWGTGKTTLVKMLKAHLEAKEHRCLYFNAWDVDYATDPLVALVSKIDLIATGGSPESEKQIKKLQSLAMLVGKRGLIASVKAATLGMLDLEKEIEAVMAQGTGDTASEMFDLVMKEGECLAKFKGELAEFAELLQQGGETRNLVFFIDELDRCRPTFAIELLERIKHLFDVPNIVFVLAIDKSQLEISTSTVYGTGINAREYLRRFIHLEFQVPQVSGRPFVEQLLNRFGLPEVFSERQGQLSQDMQNFIDVFFLLAKATKMSLRTQEHCIARLALVMTQTPANHFLHPVLTATLIVTRALNQPLFSQIRAGSASTEELMQWLQLTSAGDDSTDRLAVAVEAYMNVADPVRARRDRRRSEIQSQANHQAEGSPARNRAIELLEFMSNFKGYSGQPHLAYLVNKIDLAHNLQ